MTIDIKIGELKIKTFDEVMKERLENWNFSYKDTLSMIDFLEITQCPDEIDGCSEKDTYCPNSAYRSGSISGIHDFMKNVVGKELYEYFSPIKTNARQISRLKPVIDEINGLEYSGSDYFHKMRLHWLKFWCNRAVELYGGDAVVEFS